MYISGDKQDSFLLIEENKEAEPAKRIDPIGIQVCSLLNMSKKLLNTILKSNIQLQLSLSWFKHLTHLTPLSL